MISWLANTAFTHFLHRQGWLPQVLETVHMSGHSALVGAFVLIAARVLGFGRGVPEEWLARYVFPVCWIAVSVQVASGGLMFLMGAEQYADNAFFIWKIAAVAAGLSALVYLQVNLRRHARGWEEYGGAPSAVRIVAGLGVVAWFAALAFGRFVYTLL